MVLVNTDYISGKELEMLGMVKGSTIQCKNIGRDIGASFKNLVGGEMKAYTEMMNEARDLAIQRMVAEAEGLGADAVVNVRFATSAIIQGAAEVIAYGTAVKYANQNTSDAVQSENMSLEKQNYDISKERRTCMLCGVREHVT